MPIDRLDFDDLSEADLAELITTQVPEGLRIEYKRDLYGNADKDKRKALKDISAFANAFGGHLITLGSVILLSRLKSMSCKGLAINFSKIEPNDFNRLGEKYANRGSL